LMAADVVEEIRSVYRKLQPSLPGIQERINEGHLTEANDRLVGMFPNADRTGVQALLLGNLLYSVDPKRSYALHKDAWEHLPNQESALLEWAMEQHRAGEHKNALETYDKVSQLNPNFAPVYGLAADCLIRLGRIKEACARWQESERARDGSLEKLEEMVCEIYKDASLQLKREKLRAKAEKGDVDPALELIALDGKFERDWWNDGPQQVYLKYDLPLLEKLRANDGRVKSAQCAGECLVEKEPTKETVRAILLRHGYLIDGRTLPEESRMLALIMGIALESEAISVSVAREAFGEKLLSRAIHEKDAELFNAVCYLQIETPEMEKVEKVAWGTTGKSKFAAGYLIELLRKGALNANDPVLEKAFAEFPEDAQIHAIGFGLKKDCGQEFLVQAIKAEYKHFSISSAGVSRPSAMMLRACFAELGRVMQ